MKQTLAFIPMLLLASVALAATETVDVLSTGLGTVTYESRSLTSFTLTLPEGVTEESFLTATLELLVEPDEAQGGDVSFLEIQAAEWESGAPVTPGGKSRPVTEIATPARDCTVYLDLTPVMEEVLAAEASSVTLVVGQVSGDCAGDYDIGLLDEAANLWGRVSFHVK